MKPEPDDSDRKSITGILVLSSLNALSICLLFALFWPSSYQERITAGGVLFPVLWLTLTMAGLLGANADAYMRLNRVFLVCSLGTLLFVFVR